MDLVVLENELVTQKLEPAKIFVPMGLEPVISAIESKVREQTFDVSTAAGRKEIGSVCQKIASSKVLLDNAGKKFIEDLKAKIKPIDAERKRMRDRLDALKEETNKPRAEWETAEQARLEAEELARQIEKDHSEALEMNSWFDRQREVERREAELARIDEEKRQKEESDRIAKEQAERDERIRQEAESKAKAEAEKKAQEERARHEREIAEAKAKAEQAEKDRIAAEAKAKADQDRAVKEAEDRAAANAKREQEEKEAAAEATRKAEEKKAANKKHRAKIEDEIIAALIVGGTKEGDAIGIVGDIKEGRIPHLTINY